MKPVDRAIIALIFLSSLFMCERLIMVLHEIAGYLKHIAEKL